MGGKKGKGNETTTRLRVVSRNSVLIKWANEEKDEIQTRASRGRQYVWLVGNGRMDPYSSSRISIPSFLNLVIPQGMEVDC